MAFFYVAIYPEMGLTLLSPSTKNLTIEGLRASQFVGTSPVDDILHHPLDSRSCTYFMNCNAWVISSGAKVSSPTLHERHVHRRSTTGMLLHNMAGIPGIDSVM